MAVSCPSGRDGRQRFRIYVLEMPDGSLYVGSTAQPVSERIREHNQGAGARSHRRHRAVRRLRRLEPPQLCATRARAEEVERRTAARLRARGYQVRQG